MVPLVVGDFGYIWGVGRVYFSWCSCVLNPPRRGGGEAYLIIMIHQFSCLGSSELKIGYSFLVRRGKKERE